MKFAVDDAERLLCLLGIWLDRDDVVADADAESWPPMRINRTSCDSCHPSHSHHRQVEASATARCVSYDNDALAAVAAAAVASSIKDTAAATTTVETSTTRSETGRSTSTATSASPVGRVPLAAGTAVATIHALAAATTRSTPSSSISVYRSARDPCWSLTTNATC